MSRPTSESDQKALVCHGSEVYDRRRNDGSPDDQCCEGCSFEASLAAAENGLQESIENPPNQCELQREKKMFVLDPAAYLFDNDLVLLFEKLFGGVVEPIPCRDRGCRNACARFFQVSRTE